MQGKVEEAVYEHCETTAQRSKRHAAPEIISGLRARYRFVKKQHYKTQTQNATHDTRIRRHLQIVVVRLLQTVKPVARIVFRVNHAEGAEARAYVRMRLDDVERHGPEVRAARCWVIGIHTVDETIDRELATEQNHAEEQAEQQRTRHGEPRAHTLQPACSPQSSPLTR